MEEDPRVRPERRSKSNARKQRYTMAWEVRIGPWGRSQRPDYIINNWRLNCNGGIHVGPWTTKMPNRVTAVWLLWEGQRSKYSRRLNIPQFKGLTTVESLEVRSKRKGSRLDDSWKLETSCSRRSAGGKAGEGSEVWPGSQKLINQLKVRP